MSTTWEQMCELTAAMVLKHGFSIEFLKEMASIRLGGELGTGVCLEISAGKKAVHNVTHQLPGVAEGLRDLAQDGLEGKMIIYGLAFRFQVLDPSPREARRQRG